MFQRLPDPRFDVDRMEPVQHEEAANQLIACELADEPPGRLAGPADHVEHPVEAGPVEVQQRPHEILRRGTGRGVGGRLERVHQLVDDRHLPVELGVLRH